VTILKYFALIFEKFIVRRFLPIKKDQPNKADLD